jgi:H+/gluconate symporter-like permease
MFRQGGIPNRLIPGTIALGAFTFTMDSLPGSPQIQNIIPTTFFKTDTWAAPWLGLIGSVFILIVGMSYLSLRRKAAQKAGDGYGEGHSNEPEYAAAGSLPHPLLALLPLVAVGVLNKVFTVLIPKYFGAKAVVDLAGHPLTVEFAPLVAIRAEGGRGWRRIACVDEYRGGIRFRRSRRAARRVQRNGAGIRRQGNL